MTIITRSGYGLNWEPITPKELTTKRDITSADTTDSHCGTFFLDQMTTELLAEEVFRVDIIARVRNGSVVEFEVIAEDMVNGGGSVASCPNRSFAYAVITQMVRNGCDLVPEISAISGARMTRDSRERHARQIARETAK